MNSLLHFYKIFIRHIELFFKLKCSQNKSCSNCQRVINLVLLNYIKKKKKRKRGLYIIEILFAKTIPVISCVTILPNI